MAVPVITFQIAPGSNPTDASYTWQTLDQADGGAYVRTMQYARGRQNEMTRTETGAGTVNLADRLSDFDPENTASPFSPDVRPMMPVRAYADIGGSTYYMFQHYIERLPRPLRVTDAYTERELNTIDGFAWLANAGLAGQSYSQEASGTRVGNVLDDVSWPAGLRDLDAGNETVSAVTYAADDETKALPHLLDVADTENGFLFMDGQGRVAFIQRHALVASPYTVSQATFRDAVSGGAGYQYVEAVPSYDLDNVFNDWRGTRDGGTTQTATDSDSIGVYGPRSKAITSLAISDAVVLSQIQWKLRQFKDPVNRLASITVMPGNDTAAWQTVLGLELGERITVVETPPGFTVAQSREYIIDHISVDIPEDLVAARFTFSFQPADQAPWLVLDDTTVGKLDTGLIGY